MDAALCPRSRMSKILWKLREVLARRKISNKALAKKMNVHETTISRIKSLETLPAIGNDAVEEYRSAITDLSEERFGICKLSELVELVEE